MSPEQLSGDKLDGRSDIYSLALVFCRTLTGSLPFQADSAQETMIKRLTDEPMKLAELMPGSNFPPRLQEIMDRALTRMPSQRYASASEFARDVVRAIEGMGAPGAPAEDGATQLIGAHGEKTEQMAATRIRASTTGGKTAVKTPPTPMPQPTLQRPAEKKKPVGLIAAVVGVLVLGGGAAAVLVNKGGGNSAGEKQAVTSDTAQHARQPNTGANGAATGNQSQTGTRPAGNSANPTGGRQDKTGNQVQVATNPPPSSGVDTVKIKNDLDAILEDLGDPAKIESARARATAIYLNEKTPAAMRAEAAYDVASAHEATGDTREACRWIGMSLALRPNWATATTYQQHLACR
jgi:serine/threonine-protein kinase